LLNGQAAKLRFGSISVTCNPGSSRRSVRAQLAPAKPPPITAMRAADWANEGHGNVLAATVAAIPRAASLRVNSRVASMGTIRQGGSGGRKDRRLSHQAKLMFWSRSGTERIRLPVAAK
jgi:hypothetical protein